MRNLIFVSHANPEDNQFARWITLQLANHGYRVWCDLTKLLGGEDFEDDIDEAIRVHTVKFLFVLSQTSHHKPGPREELTVARNVGKTNRFRDFVIPLSIDNVHHKEKRIEVARTNSIPFEEGWAKGLQQLLEKLEKDNVPKSPAFTPSAVTSWWRSHFSADEGVMQQPEQYLSNWFPIEEPPPFIYFHTLARTEQGRWEVAGKFPYPAFRLEPQYLASFAPADDFIGQLGPSIIIEDTMPFSTLNFLDGVGGIPKHLGNRRERRNLVYRLLRLAWEQMAEERNLLSYELANEAKCFYFLKGFSERNRVHFLGVNDKKTYRGMIGPRNRKMLDGSIQQRFWHFAVQAKPLIPDNLENFAYIIKPHVVFTDDGRTVWSSTEKLHQARRSQCKNWWNAEWRDRILAAVSWLSDNEESFDLKVGSEVSLKISSKPMIFESRVSFLDPVKDLGNEEDDILSEADEELLQKDFEEVEDDEEEM